MNKITPDEDRFAAPPHLHSMRHEIAGEFVRFVVMGGANTLVTYLVYLLLLRWVHYELAYAIGYGIGIAMAFALSTAFVFRQPVRKCSVWRFPLIYIAQFFSSLLILRVAVEHFHVPQWLALGIAVMLTMPVTFALSRWVFRSD